MPILPNPRHERFAQELAKGKSAAEAYAEAGYKPNKGNPSSLKADQRISQRVAELLAERDEMARKSTEKAAEALAIDRQWVLGRLVENARIALGEQKMRTSLLLKGSVVPIEAEITMRDATAANRALELLGKELGMFIDRSELSHTVRDITDTLPTEEEWAAEYASKH